MSMPSMTIGRAPTPPSRRGKKQIVAYLDPRMVTAVHAKARAEDKSLQEILGEALNAAMEIHGRNPVIQISHDRIVRRSRGHARVKSEDNAPKCRSGTKALGGWFDESEYDAVKAFASEVGLPIQKLVEIGIEQITGLRDYIEADDA